jgi:hypothetical protein
MKPKNLPRLWCALRGLLPLDACLAAQRGELAWPAEPAGNGPSAQDKGVSQQPGRPRREVCPATEKHP